MPFIDHGLKGELWFRDATTWSPPFQHLPSKIRQVFQTAWKIPRGSWLLLTRKMLITLTLAQTMTFVLMQRSSTNSILIYQTISIRTCQDKNFEEKCSGQFWIYTVEGKTQFYMYIMLFWSNWFVIQYFFQWHGWISTLINNLCIILEIQVSVFPIDYPSIITNGKKINFIRETCFGGTIAIIQNEIFFLSMENRLTKVSSTYLNLHFYTKVNV